MNTYLGLFCFTLLIFGVASAPAIFHSLMDRVFVGLEGTVCYLDDVLIAGKNEHGCLRRNGPVLQRLRKHGIRVNADECQFFKCHIRYMGHKIDEVGIYTTKDKVEAILMAPTVTGVSELEAFLGVVNFYARFLSQTAPTLEPL